MEEEHPQREISPRTIKNFYYAKAHEVLRTDQAVWYVNLWTDHTRWLPEWRTTEEQWIQLNGVGALCVVTRVYWLRLGVCHVTPIERVGYD